MMRLDDDAREVLATTLGDETDDFVRGYAAALGDCVQLQTREALINTQSFAWLREYIEERGIDVSSRLYAHDAGLQQTPVARAEAVQRRSRLRAHGEALRRWLALR